MQAGLYARVSTSGQSVAMQLDELRAYCERRGWQVTVEHTDEGVSGRRESRPGLDALLRDVQQRKVDVVVVYRYDRFARSVRQLANALGNFDALGVGFVSIHEGADTTTPTGRLLFAIFAGIAEFEASLIRERVVSGLAAAKRRGRVGGRRAKVTPLTLREIRALRGQGLSLEAIGARLQLDKSTVSRALRAE